MGNMVRNYERQNEEPGYEVAWYEKILGKWDLSRIVIGSIHVHVQCICEKESMKKNIIIPDDF
jgi:hypothetical protein